MPVRRRATSVRRDPPPREHQDPRYAAPSHVVTIDLMSLLAGVREIVPEQQARLGFDGNSMWCAGDVSLVRQPAVAIVGTRKASPEGAARARRLGRELAVAGVVVVSGLARGVDTEALTAAMGAGGRVIAVIGTPIDKAYPAENKRLQERIYREHLLISQFEAGRRVFQGNFPERNKLMAAITDATAIIEAGEASGTLHQAAECVRLRRWLFIPRSVMDDPLLRWPDRFRHETTVRILTDTADILSVLPSRP
jgi:DNA processing protein